MADELPQEAQSNLIDALASKQMGVEPQQAQAPAEPAEAPETAEEKAVDEGSPQTEGDKMDMEAILYEIDFGDGDMRKLNPNQIRETFKRYRDLNFQNQQNANLNKVVEAAIKNGFAKNPDDAARQILNMMKAAQSNPQMGDEDGKTNVQASAEMTRDALSQWEEDNAVALPLASVSLSSKWLKWQPTCSSFKVCLRKSYSRAKQQPTVQQSRLLKLRT